MSIFTSVKPKKVSDFIVDTFKIEDPAELTKTQIAQIRHHFSKVKE